MESLAEVVGGIVVFILEMSLRLVGWITQPVKFIFSATFRRQTLNQWREKPRLAWVQIPLCIGLLVGFSLVVWFWIWIFNGMIEDHRHPERVDRREIFWRRMEDHFKREMDQRAREKQKREHNEPLPE